MNWVSKLSFVCWLLWLLLLVAIIVIPCPQTQALIYTSRNECVSHETVYQVKYQQTTFAIEETIIFSVMSPVKNCYFYAENFSLQFVRMFRGKWSVLISVDEIGDRTIAIQLLDGSFLQPNENYTVVFWATKLIRAVDEGLVFKNYRDLYTMKISWYSIVKIGPANCGKVYICINSLRSVQKLIIVATHPSTHQLLCPGATTKPVPIDGGEYVRTECFTTCPVAVNNMHFAVADFLTLDYDGLRDGNNSHRIKMIAPKDEFGQTFQEIHRQFSIIQRIFSLLLLTVNIKQFHVFIYALPDGHEMQKPVIRGGVCYFNFDKIHFQLDLEVIYRGYLRCLLHQGFMTERRSDSWSHHYAAEGLFERMIADYEVFSTHTSFYRDAIEGDSDDLAALAKQYEDTTMIRVNRPWRKAAGFFTILASISPSYAEATYCTFLYNNETAIENNYSSFLAWITAHAKKLGLKAPHLMEVVDTWTMADGYPVIKSDVVANRTICVEHYNVGPHLRSYLLPIQVDFNFPDTVHSKTIWTNPRSSKENCVTVVLNLYPYLINSYFNMVGRVNYDVLNWRIWADKLMKVEIRQGLGAMRKVALVTDALYFAGRRQLSYSIALRFLFAMQTEGSEEAWRNFDKTLQLLDAKIRYTGVYTLFRKTIGEVSESYFNKAVVLSARPSELAHKWSCMMGHPLCLNETEAAVTDTLRDHRVRHAPEVLCAGMRRLSLERLHQLIHTMGRPDWREPEFYVQMMLCAEDPLVLRELMHHMFFQNSWQFKEKKLTEMVLKMMRASKSGTDAMFYYLNHDPVGVFKRLGCKNMLKVVDELVLYTKENCWFLRLVGRFKVNGVVWEDLVKRKKGILEKLKENKKWYNTQYKDIRRFFMVDYGTYLKKFEYERGEEEMED